MGYIKIGYIEIECPIPVPMRLMRVEPWMEMEPTKSHGGDGMRKEGGRAGDVYLERFQAAMVRSF